MKETASFLAMFNVAFLMAFAFLAFLFAAFVEDNKKYSLPFDPTNPAIKIVDAPYHRQVESIKNDTDFYMPAGTLVLAARDGVVISLEEKYNKTYNNPSGAKEYNFVKIRHIDGEWSFYVHLKSVEVTVSESVKRGEVIGLSGQVGFATYPHLHFGVYSKDDKSLMVDFIQKNFDYAPIPISPAGIPIFNK